MYVCQICKHECKTMHALVMHLKGKAGKNGHPYELKDYYDKFIKTNPNEGMCQNPNCPHGKNETKFISLSKGYAIGCTKSCIYRHPDIANKKKKTNLERRGTEFPTQSKEVLLKREQNSINTYGVSHHMKTDKYKQMFHDIHVGKTPNQPAPENDGRRKESANIARDRTNRERYGNDYTLVHNERSVKTQTERYGGVGYAVPEHMQKSKETMIEKYGYQHPMENDENKNKISKANKDSAEESSIKRMKTLEEKYGVIGMKSSLQDPEVRRKATNTLMERYGAKTYAESEEAKHKHKSEKRKKTLSKIKENINTFNKFVMNVNDKSDKIIDYNVDLKWKCKQCNVEFVDNLEGHDIPRCDKCKPFYRGNSSKLEENLYQFLKSILPNDTVIYKNDTIVLDGKELDLYIPDRNLAIEVNGLYWHSEITGKKDKNYHRNKTIACYDKGINLLQIFEDEILHKSDIVKSIIKNKLGLSDVKIGARECQGKKVTDYHIIKSFLTTNHIQGSIPSSGTSYGLFHNGELVQLLVFGKSRFNKNYDWEIIRFATKLNHTIQGGFSKLFTMFIHEHNPNNIITYSDARFGIGKVYTNVDFTLIDISDSGYFYIGVNGKRHHRIEFQKHKLKDHPLIESFDPNLTEWDNMVTNGFDRIWDCGNYVYSYQRQT
jgi:hypothetical protein